MKTLKHIVSVVGIQPNHHKVTALVELPPPKNVREFKRRLGMVKKECSCYRYGVFKLVAFGSHSSNSSERQYAPIEKEELTIVWGCEMFWNFIIGKVITNHKPLITI